MRGKRDIVGESLKDKRNIPAYAGKTLMFSLDKNKTAEHPRVCGENLQT